MVNNMTIATVRTTLVLENTVMQKLRQDFGNNISAAVNAILKERLFATPKDDLFGSMKGKISAKDLIRDED